MTLRIMLLSLVASLGLELPKDDTLSTWMHTGREWVVSMVGEPKECCGEPNKLDAAVAVCHATSAESSCRPAVVEPSSMVADAAFETVTNALAADFAADPVVADALESKATDPSMSSVEVAEMTEAPAVGLPDGEEMASLPVVAETVVQEATPTCEEAMDMELAEAATVEESTTSTEATEVTPSRADRLAHALQLTRDAMNAWAEVMQEPAAEAVSTR